MSEIELVDDSSSDSNLSYNSAVSQLTIPNSDNFYPYCLIHPYTVECVRILKYVILFFILLGFIIAIAVVVYVYIHPKPQQPKLDISKVILHYETFEDTSSFFNYNITIGLNLSNPNSNKNLHIRVDSAKLVVAHTLVGTTNLSTIKINARYSQLLSLDMSATNLQINQDLQTRFKNRMILGRHYYLLYIQATVKWTLSSADMSSQSPLLVRCTFEASSPPEGYLLERDCR